MSQQALGAALDRVEIQANPESTSVERDWIELTVRRVSRVVAYLVIR